jgi:hypothetical protein
MVVGGVLFAIASLRAAVLPRSAVLGFLAGVLLNLVFSFLPVPEEWQTLGSTVRNLGLIGMGAGLLRQQARGAAV